MMPISVSFVIPLVFFIAVFGTLFLLLILILNRKNIKSVFFKHKIIYGLVFSLVFIADLLFIYGVYESQKIADDSKLKREIKVSREKFTLSRDWIYGEFTVPKGTYIERYDAFDSGEPDRAFRLTGLRYAKFPKSTKIAGVWASSYSTIGQLQLSKDQLIKGVICKKNQIALFKVPSIEYDIIENFGKERPTGANARFKPSQWSFIECME
jgi:hypothetical protein